MSSPTEEDAIVKETLNLIDQGWGKIVQSQCSINTTVKRSVIFALGGTGAGKSTLTQIITENLQKLHSVPGKHGCGLVIVDKIENTAEGRIGDPQVASKTFLPEYLSCEDDPNLVFVDCPGFNDNRGIHMDIASMVLIKKIAEQVNHARFMFVIPSSSVSYSNINRNDFISLCTHATSFVKNLDKIKQAMGLIITKVNNCDPATGQPIEDHSVIHETSVFLEEVASQQSTSVENRHFIHCLLDNKSKWVLIRYPNKLGPLSEMYHFVQVRKEIRDTCHRKLKAVPVTPDDFAITLSADSKYIIARRLIPYMRGEISKIVTRLVGDMEVLFVLRFQRELQLQKSGLLVVTLMKNLEHICEKLNQTGSTQDVRTDGNLLPVTNKVIMAENWLEINLVETRVIELRNVEEKLYLFQQVTGENDEEENGSSSASITNAFNILKTNLEELHKSTMRDVKSTIVPNVETLLQDEAINVVKLFDNKYTDAFWSSLESADEYGQQAFEKIGKDWSYFETLENCGFGSADEMISTSLTKFTNDMQVPIEKGSFKKLEELESELEILLELIGQSGRGLPIGGNLIPEIRKVFRAVRTQAHAIVKSKYIKMVNAKVEQQTSALMCSLEEAFFNESVHPGLNLESIAQKRQLLTDVHADLQKCQKNFSNGILPCVLEIFKIFGKELSENDNGLLGEYESILDFYDNVLGAPVARPIEEWMTPVRSLIESIYGTAALYEFLELAMSTNPNTIDEDLTVKEGDEENLILRFLVALRATSEIRRNVQTKARPQDLQMIKNIARYLQSGKTNLKFADGKKMLVKGRHVKFSDFINESGWLRGCYSLPITKVLVMCSGTVYLDRDLLGKGQQLTFTVIADKWVIQGGKRFIDLSGCDGIPHQERKAKDGKEYGGSGDDGFPGNCGGNGGNFFGIYNKIVNGSGLYIFSNGGNGGDGQSGGDGGFGCPGRDAEYPMPIVKTKSTIDVLRSILLPGPFSILARYGPFDSTILPGPPNPIVSGLSFPISSSSNDSYTDDIISKKAGGNGGRGGDGGVGGIPGFSGVIKLFSLASVASIINVSCNKGKHGRPGRGGDGGRGGRNGHQDPRHGPGGRSGRTGRNSRRQNRSPPQVIKDLDWRDVEEFRKYILEECEGCSVGLRFLQLIDNDLEISRRLATL